MKKEMIKPKTSPCKEVKLTNLYSVLHQVLFLEKLPLLLMAVFMTTACEKPILDDEGSSEIFLNFLPTLP